MGDDRFCAQCGRARPAPTGGGPVSPHPVVVPTNPVKKGPPIAAAVGLLVIFGAIVPILVFSGGSCNGSTEGNVAVSGGPRPSFTFTPTGCASMQPYGRFGANLHGDGPNDGAVYVTMDPVRGPAVEVELPGSCRNSNGTDCTVFPVPRERCTTFEANVEFTGVTVNDVRQVEGHVAVDCSLEDGTTVRGRVTFDGC